MPSETYPPRHRQRILEVGCWFGLVNQVANYAQLRDIMEPFKPFLSLRCKFSWSPQLEEAFQLSKDAIICAIRQGVGDLRHA